MKTLRDLIGCVVLMALVSTLGCKTPGNKTFGNTPGCQDTDGDGYGLSCPRGPDCDENDPKRNISCDCNTLPYEGCPCQGGAPMTCFEAGSQNLVGVGPCRAGQRECKAGKWGACLGQVLPEPESCDQIDNDCNGKLDDSAACTSCGARCSQEVTGGNGTNSAGFRVDADNSNGLTRTPEGFLILTQSAQPEGMKFMFVANADEGTVSKIEVATGKEVARYISALTQPGPRNRASAPARAENSPSRTAVDFNGDVWVANRAFNKQGSVTKISHSNCADANGNGKIETSSDVNGDGKIDLNDPREFLGEADECIMFTVNVGGINAIPRALALDGGGVDVRKSNAWVGAWTEQKFYKLDGEDGHILAEVPVGLKPYGAAIDSSGILWSTEFNANKIVSVSTLTNNANPVVPMGNACPCYGIAIDLKNRVWVGGWDKQVACRYDPADGSIFPVAVPGVQGKSRGIAVDAEGNIWNAYDGSPGTLVRFKADDGSAMQKYPFPSGNGTIGVGIDFHGKAWGVNRLSNNTCRVDPATGATECFPAGVGPYTYSDFTGFALQHITAPMGTYRTIFKGCMSEQATNWKLLTWDSEVPPDTAIEVYVKAGNTVDELQVARRQGPFTKSPVDLAANDKIVGEQLWVEVVLSTQKQGVTPKLKSLSVQKVCGGVD